MPRVPSGSTQDAQDGLDSIALDTRNKLRTLYLSYSPDIRSKNCFSVLDKLSGKDSTSRTTT